ncbi:MAG: hypothetical protein IPJ94_27490 [Chloroflexi bacterium]|nr:hypothetical protein [Chloroflexota bacterium]
MFKNQVTLEKTILCGICLVLLLVGCQLAVGQDNETVLTTETISNKRETVLPTATRLAPTRSISQTATSTWTPIPPPTISPTPQPSPTSLPTETATSTPWPTLSPDEAANKVLSLLAENQNPDCLLPCWWGATPGQTYWQDIEPVLRSFALEIDSDSSAAFVILPLHESIKVPGFDGYVAYSWDESGIINAISVKSMNMPGYDPSTMMSFYGIPDEVWVKTFSELLPGEVLPFRLILVYQEQGISFRYYVDAVRTGETVTACFEPGIEMDRPDLFPAGPRIYLWEPGQHKTIDEIVNIPDETYFPLEEKTSLTPETLYEKFTDPNQSPCIDTPADLWINP